MKKQLFFLAFLASIAISAFQSCSSDSDSDPALNVTHSGETVSAAGGNTSFNIESNTGWTVTKPSEASWITAISPESGNGSKQVILTIETNEAGQRSAILTVKAGELTREVTVTQAADDNFVAELSVENTPGTIAAKGGDVTFEIKSNTEWTITKPDDIEWITTIDPASGSGDTSVTVTVDTNDDTRRSTELTVRADGLIRKVTITQAGKQITGDVALENLDYSSFYGFGGIYSSNASNNYYLSISSGLSTSYTGCILTLDLYGNIAGDHKVLPTGTFTVSNSFNAGSIYPTYSYYEEQVDKEITRSLSIAQGTVTISKSGDNYTIDIDLVAGDGTKITGQYQGPSANKMEDLVLTEYEVGYIDYYGDVGSGGASSFVTSHFGGGVLVTASGWGLTLDIYATPGASASLPDGTYNVSSSRAANCIAISDDTIYGSIVALEYTEDSRDIVYGSATVSRSGTNYTFNLALKDMYGYDITGTLTGKLTYYDNTTRSAAYERFSPRFPDAGNSKQPAHYRTKR